MGAYLMTAIDSALRHQQQQNFPSTHQLAHSAANLRSGERLGHILCGRYRLEHLLGKGAMGEVYRATDLSRNEPCAVKLVLPEASLPLQAAQRLVQEAKVISRLYHPNIVHVREFVEDQDGTFLLVMELLHGVDLHKVLGKQGKLPLWRALEIIRSVGAALQYAHEMGVIHRDVSPGNIFLAQQSEWTHQPHDVIKVLDFGLAKLMADFHDQSASGGPITKGIIVGTPAYLPPEAALSVEGRRDPRSDQWSLGVVLFRMLAGRLPFDQSSPYQLYTAICYEPPPELRELAPNLPEHIYSTVETALSKSCADRFSSVKNFLRALDGLPALTDVTARMSDPRLSAKTLPPPDSHLPQIDSHLPQIDSHLPQVALSELPRTFDLREKTIRGDVIASAALSAGSVGLPGVTRLPPSRRKTRTEPPTGAHPSTERSPLLHRPSPVPAADPSASEPPPPSPSTPMAHTDRSAAPVGWLASFFTDSQRAFRQGLLMMGVGMALTLGTVWALGLQSPRAPRASTTGTAARSLHAAGVARAPIPPLRPASAR